MQKQEKLKSFISWAVAAALEADSAERLVSKDDNLCCRSLSGGGSCEDSLTSKLLRWLTASVILGKLCGKTNKADCKLSKGSGFRTLESLLEHVSGDHGEFSQSRVGSENVLATTILYLQQSVTNCNVLPSAVSALCFLLLESSSFSGMLM